MMQAKPFNQHSPHYEQFLSSVDAILNAIEKPKDFALLDQNSPKLSIILKINLMAIYLSKTISLKQIFTPINFIILIIGTITQKKNLMN